MQLSPYHFLPFPLFIYLFFVALFFLVVAMIEIGVVHYAADRLGLERRSVFLLLLLCLIGSYINIPITKLAPEPIESSRVVTVWGVPYVIPVVRQWPSTVVAVNVGGALIPVGVAVYLMVKNRLYLASLFGILLVTFVVHSVARPIRGIGISVPIFTAPIAAALVALLLAGRQSAAPLAYIAGTLGTLIGADLMNLGSLPGLGAPVASIGGAGTFDGVFLTGILAILLA
jgi:uncharacterized membrane protein